MHKTARSLDTVMTAGGDYQANSAFGYTPLGGSVTAIQDGSYNMNVNGQRISGIAPEYARMSVYGQSKVMAVAVSCEWLRHEVQR